MTRAIDRSEVTFKQEHDGAPPAAAESHAAAHHNGHDPHLAHHYATPSQQYEASKFGMWLFLGTELLFFGGLFVLYAVYRGNNPEMFAYGAQYMSSTLGAINTAVLILSSMTMAFAVRYAQLGRKNALAMTLGLTLLGGGIFMGIKYVEYEHKISHGLVWGINFYGTEQTAVAAAPDPDFQPAPVAPAAGDADKGRGLWMNTCIACHGDRGQGMPGQAFDIRDSPFIQDSSDGDLLAFIKQGRMGFDPASRTGIQMPPKGGNPRLNDDDLRDIIAYIRTLEPPAAAAPLTEETDGEAATAAPAEPEHRMDIRLMRSSIPPAEIGPRGLAAPYNGEALPPAPDTLLHPSIDPDRPANAHMFFGIYYMMTGLHGIHVLAGMGLIGWLLLGTLRGRYCDGYFTPIENTGLFWHLVDLIWIFLFPLFYLIH